MKFYDEPFYVNNLILHEVNYKKKKKLKSNFPYLSPLLFLSLLHNLHPENDQPNLHTPFTLIRIDMFVNPSVKVKIPNKFAKL